MTHRMNFLKNTLVLIVTASALTACGGDDNPLGYGKNAPDEFAVVTKAPLIIPPDFFLRPPTNIGKKPNLRASREQAREILIGQSKSTNVNISEAETMLLIKAGARGSSNQIRDQIEKDGKTIIKKDEAFLKTLLFGEADQKAKIINPDAEAKRLQKNKQQGKKPNEGKSELISDNWSILDIN